MISPVLVSRKSRDIPCRRLPTYRFWGEKYSRNNMQLNPRNIIYCPLTFKHILILGRNLAGPSRRLFKSARKLARVPSISNDARTTAREFLRVRYFAKGRAGPCNVRNSKMGGNEGSSRRVTRISRAPRGQRRRACKKSEPNDARARPRESGHTVT